MNDNEKIIDLLEKLLKVAGLQVGAEKSITERARLLKFAGLDNKTIAEILNTSPLTISVLTSNLRKKNKK